MNLNKELFDLWFVDIKPWDKEVQERSRLVWLRISGIPLKAWIDRCFKMIGESMGEVVMIHGDTKTKSILCEGRILVICSAEHKIVKQVSLKVEEQIESATESEYSSEQNEEDQDFDNAKICVEDDMSMDEEHSMHDSLLNSYFKSSEEGKVSWHAEEKDADIEDGASGPSKTNGPLEGKEIGLRSKSGLRGDFRQEEIKRRGSAVPIAGIGDEGGCRGVTGEVGGLGSVLKRKEVGKLVRIEQPNFLFLQETKLETGDDDLCRMMWNSNEIDWVMKESIGASGGLLWEWGLDKVKCNLVNVYGPNDRQKRLKLWDELEHMIIEEGGRWLIAGDFNAVRCLEERRGRTGESTDMKKFDEFILVAGLVDIKMVNRHFTWYRPDGTAMSRLDRFLMNAEMCSMGGNWVQQGLKRNISNHCAIVLNSRTTDWGPKPFRVLDAWQPHPDFKKVIEEKWSEMEVDGFAGYKCKQKLKGLKAFLKGWNKEVFGNMEAQYEQAAKQVEQIDMKNEEIDLDELEITQRQEGFQKMWDIMRRREVIWKQKLRSNWVRVGDANTRFFHRVANGRKAQNHITGLLRDGCWVEEPEQVKKEVYNYFSKLFQGDTWNRPKLCEVSFKQISTEEKQWLERPFSIEEIEEGLQSCEGSKAPRLDGYNFNFLKFAWDSLKEDFTSFFAEFHKNGRLVSGLNSSFLALIPKKFNSIELKDYRPISLIGCVYKLLTKVLANRIKAVMPGITSETQSAFLRGRQLVDGVLVLNEVVEEVKRRKQSAFVFKADFAKAYDCVDWSFLDWMMDCLGFGIKWRGWIMECLSTSKILVLVNGSLTEEFKVGKGLRQGDPLSPFLFLMIGEGLNGLVQKVVSEGMFRGIEIGRKGLAVSLLQFADDTVIMGKADIENIIMVKTILRWISKYVAMWSQKITFYLSGNAC
ncbi:hypothetical protein SLEP1_g40981 [Rubroshorea leprosula]|uniref:Reverse transcriptase domain-containing protein n=1 Tax=Rubroshorea leprosula TaxID=152421 RepID=A0AAV5L529_9ROSI|nr:hypothetical protein SLEP1_g40981 [Rubroshorea leprosula]